MNILNQAELDRLERQIRIEGIGMDGQIKIKQSCALVSRVGGVGGTAAMNLARAGIGKLYLVHGGDIVPEYLNRMQLAYPMDIGRPCTDAFTDELRKINPDIEIEAINQHITDVDVGSFIDDVDIVVDGAPLFEERYTLNNIAVTHQKPMVSGAMYSMEGYITTILPGTTACLKCIYPQKPEYWTNIKVFPAIGPGPVIIGTMMAMEALKLITGIGDTLQNKLWYFDLESNHIKTFSIEKNQSCEACGQLH